MLDTTFPHDKPQMLYWNVQSEFDGEATIEITYFTSGITWSADYVCIADAEETKMGLEGFVRVSNNSGEEYEDAQVRLVVGKINLVEKIAQLAQDPDGRSGADRRRTAKRTVARAGDEARRCAPWQPCHGCAGGASCAAEAQGDHQGRPERILHLHHRRHRDDPQRLVEADAELRGGTTVPFKIQYRYRPPEYGDQLVRMYLLTNDKESKLGTTPLPDGMVRVFRDNGRDGL